jgi:hypothetical protein
LTPYVVLKEKDEKRIRLLNNERAKNPYAKTLKKQITLRMGIPETPYFIIDKSPQKGKISKVSRELPELSAPR